MPGEKAISRPRLHEAELARRVQGESGDGVRGDGGAVGSVRVGEGEDAGVAVR